MCAAAKLAVDESQQTKAAGTNHSIAQGKQKMSVSQQFSHII